MKIILRVLAAIIAIVVIAITCLMLTFTAEKLNVAAVEVGDLPPASSPAGMSTSALPTGSMESRAAFAFRGGSWNDIRQFSMTALLIRHPKGNLLIDTGFGKNVDKHVKLMPALMQKMTTYSKESPVAARLAAGGIKPDDLAGVILTHAHWDHVSGLDDLSGVPVMVDAAEKGFIDAKTHNTELLNSFSNINYKQYEFEGGPYLGFPSSHDVWGDGSVVIVPAPGHTPGSVVVFVNLPSGTRYALLGDLVWQVEGIELPAQKPWLLRRLIGEDDDQVLKNIALMRSISKKYTQIHLVPAHDPSAFRMIPVFPASAHKHSAVFANHAINCRIKVFEPTREYALMLQAGIVGLPNVGKSTLFNALTAQEAALAANYPFATIEPNVGVVAVPDERLAVLEKLNKAQKVVPAMVEFLDIAGLVRGASKGEGLGNQFLANIRETHAVIQVVRCFDDDNIIHVEGSVNPVRDIETIQIELALADLASAEKRKDKATRAAKSGGDKDAKRELEILDKILPVLEEGRPARAATLTDDEWAIVKTWFFLSTKPTIYAANVDEETLADPDANPHVQAVKKHAASENADVVVICAKLEAELVALDPAERDEYLKDLGLTSSGVDKLIKAAYHMLGLMSFLTAGEKEVRAWTIPIGTKAPAAAGEIHTDIERGFIRAEIIGYDDLVACGSRKAASEKGLARLEGKEYVMQDGDVVDFRFNV